MYPPITIANSKMVPPLVNSNPFVTCIKTGFMNPFFCNKVKTKPIIPANIATTTMLSF